MVFESLKRVILSTPLIAILPFLAQTLGDFYASAGYIRKNKVNNRQNSVTNLFSIVRYKNIYHTLSGFL